MNEELLKRLLRWKLDLARGVVQRLPEPLQAQVRGFETQFLLTIAEVGKDYLEKDRMAEETGCKKNPQAGGVQAIPVE